MNVTPDMIHRTRQQWDTEDLAINFVEEELGRYDWLNNWSAAKAKGNVRERVEEWLKATNVDHSPDEVVHAIDDLVQRRAGKWS